MNPTLERLIGRALRGVRAGDRHLAWNAPALAGLPDGIALDSPAFAAQAALPLRYAGIGVGDNLSPPLRWSGVPAASAELVLVIEDPDAPLPRPVVHALATGIPPRWQGLPEGALALPAEGPIRLGRGFLGRRGYAGPRPVRGHGAHRYVFQIIAVDRPLVLAEPAGLAAVLAALAGHALAKGRLIGTFERP
ncbi:MAG TPA: YbhB/YbcL family Raf kinase inhibitor-like protein [Stellaceae bacterium]|nr:YbhB/YbcL family Raf kinase inhibitor-like protein [Stellaceae bacterium]